MFEKLVHLQIKYSKLVLLVIFLVIGFATNTAFELRTNPDFGVLIPQDSQYNTNDRILNNAFEGNSALIVFIEEDSSTILDNVPSDMRSEIIQDYILRLESTIKQSQYYLRLSPIEYSEDFSKARFVISLQLSEEVGGLQKAKIELESLIQEAGSPPGITTQVTGFPIVLDRVSTLLIQDNINTIIFTVAFIFLILYFYSRSIKFSLITLATPVVSVILLASMMVLLKIDVTITLAAVGVLMLGLGADYGIHISTHYFKAREEKEDHEEALKHTINDLKLPITASFITTLAGFSALILGVSPSSQAQGIVLSMGIALIYATTFALFPVLVTAFAQDLKVRPSRFFIIILDYLGKLAAYQVRYAKLIIFGVFIVTLIMMYGASQVQFSTSNSNWIPDGDPTSKIQRDMEYNFGESWTLTLVIKATEGDLRDIQTMRDLNEIKSKIEGIDRVDIVDSPYDGIAYNYNEMYETITYNKEISSKFNSDYTLTTINIRSANFGENDAGNSLVLGEVKEIIAQNPVYDAEVSLYGDLVRFDELGDSLQRDTGVTTLIGLFMVFLVATLIYASLAIGFLALLPIIIAVIWAVGLMGFFGVPFTSLSTGIISLVLGIGVDFSIHLVDSIRRYSRTLPFDKAVYQTMTVAGKAIFLSSLTTFIGFLALTFATLLGTQRLGWSLAFAIVAVFFVSIFLVPSIMSLLYRNNTNAKNG